MTELANVKGPVTLIVSSRQHPCFSRVLDADGKLVERVISAGLALNTNSEYKSITLTFSTSPTLTFAPMQATVELGRIEFDEDHENRS